MASGVQNESKFSTVNDIHVSAPLPTCRDTPALLGNCHNRLCMECSHTRAFLVCIMIIDGSKTMRVRGSEIRQGSLHPIIYRVK